MTASRQIMRQLKHADETWRKYLYDETVVTRKLFY